MKVHVYFYKGTGKYYSDGIVDVGDAKLWREKMVTTPTGDTHETVTREYNEIAVAIGANQQILNKGAITRSEFTVVVHNIEPWDVATEFCDNMFKPEDFPPGS